MLRKLCITLGGLIGLASPAMAETWLVFEPGNNRPAMTWDSATAPTPGVELPDSDKVMKWVPENDENGDLDGNPRHYYYFTTGVRRWIDPTGQQ